MNIHQCLAACIEGTLVAQLAINRGLQPSDVLTENDIVIKQLRRELKALGIDCQVISQNVLDGLIEIYATDKAMNELGGQYGKLLWSILGDPVNGGSEPPETYVDAAKSLWVTFLATVNPRFLNLIQNLRDSND